MRAATVPFVNTPVCETQDKENTIKFINECMFCTCYRSLCVVRTCVVKGAVGSNLFVQVKCRAPCWKICDGRQVRVATHWNDDSSDLEVATPASGPEHQIHDRM